MPTQLTVRALRLMLEKLPDGMVVDTEEGPAAGVIIEPTGRVVIKRWVQPPEYVPVPDFAKDYPDQAQTLEQTRLPFYCCNCQRKRPTRYMTPDLGPFCQECYKQIPLTYGY